MVAVAAAIGAAFLAGFVALFREHRVQERQLMVAARVVDEVLQTAKRGITVSLKSNTWRALNSMPTHESFVQTWEGLRGDLAGHLAYPEWQALAAAIAAYEALRSMQQETLPKECEDVLTEVTRLIALARVSLKPYRTDRFTLPRQVQRHYKRGDWSSP
jgi:hypothetical protein